ncbi:MAG: hypothetical protein QM808_09595 [Steroidobacteraceae bacterium]
MKKSVMLAALSMSPLAVALLGVSGTAHADQISIAEAKAKCAAVDVGPRTTYGETKAEVAAKKVAFQWACGVLVEGKAKEAFEKYVSKDFCDHSHMANAGLKECSNYDEVLKQFSGMAAMMAKGGKIEFPVVATVNGDMVTQYGEGVDIFRVKDGKITDHWDASPPTNRNITAHDQEFSDRMQKQIDTGKRQGIGIGSALPGSAPAPAGK